MFKPDHLYRPMNTKSLKPKTGSAAVTSYITGFPKEVQTILKKMRSTVKSAAPKLTEGISYGIPTFYLNGKYLVYIAGFKKHVSVYPAITPAVEKVKGLSAYKVSKGTLKFPLTEPIPYEMIKKFVAHRVKESNKK